MEDQYHSRHEKHNVNHRQKNSSFLGIVLIILGVGWILKETGWLHGIPGLHAIQHAVQSFTNIFHFDAWSITWPLILLVVGIVLIAGRRLIGALLILFAIFFFLPGFIIIPGILTVVFLPVILIILGVIVISRLL